MYHQSKNSFSSQRTSIPPERPLFLQRANVQEDTGLVLSTDAKPRLKWTPELHERFIEAVGQLGGAEKATPKTVFRVMGVPGLTLYHLKSHLQKYRLSKNLHSQSNNGNTKNGSMASADRISETTGTLIGNTNMECHVNNGLQISETLQMQIEVQRKLNEQLEVQRHLQLRIEAQGKYLQSVLEKAQETLGRQNPGSAGLEAARAQISQLVSKVSTECLDSSFSGLTEVLGLSTQQTQMSHIADCSMDSCLTSCEGSQKDQEIQNFSMGLGSYNGNGPVWSKEIVEDLKREHTETGWEETLNDSKMSSSSMEKETDGLPFQADRNFGELSMSIRIQGDKGSCNTIYDARQKERDVGGAFLEQPNSKRSAFQPGNGKSLKGFGLPNQAVELDLNAHDINDVASNCKQFDLNGFSWS